MIYQESAELAAFDAIMDPLILIYLSIAIILYTLFSYKKVELRLFVVPMIFFWLSEFFMFLKIEFGEAIFISISGVTMVLAMTYYQSKMKAKTKAKGGI